MEERLPDINELGNDFWDSFSNDPDEAFFNSKALEIINTISDENYIKILEKAGIEDAEDESEYKDEDTLASALFMGFSLSDDGKSAEEYYKSLNL